MLHCDSEHNARSRSRLLGRLVTGVSHRVQFKNSRLAVSKQSLSPRTRHLLLSWGDATLHFVHIRTSFSTVASASFARRAHFEARVLGALLAIEFAFQNCWGIAIPTGDHSDVREANWVLRFLSAVIAEAKRFVEYQSQLLLLGLRELLGIRLRVWVRFLQGLGVASRQFGSRGLRFPIAAQGALVDQSFGDTGRGNQTGVRR